MIDTAWKTWPMIGKSGLQIFSITIEKRTFGAGEDATSGSEEQEAQRHESSGISLETLTFCEQCWPCQTTFSLLTHPWFNIPGMNKASRIQQKLHPLTCVTWKFDFSTYCAGSFIMFFQGLSFFYGNNAEIGR